jgi:hypothetical protein
MSNVTSDDVAPSASFTRNLNELEYAGTAQRLSTRCHLSLLPGVSTLNEFRIEVRSSRQYLLIIQESGRKASRQPALKVQRLSLELHETIPGRNPPVRRHCSQMSVGCYHQFHPGSRGPWKICLASTMSLLLLDTQRLARPRPYAQRHSTLCTLRVEASRTTMLTIRISLERGFCARRSQLECIE